MKIRQLTLRNFISYFGENSIVFPDGLTVIVGQNGAGKTSLLDAISYSLYKVHNRGRADTVLINSRSQEMLLELTFSASGRDYQLTWNVKKSKGGVTATATLRQKPGKILIYEGGEKTILPEVEKITGLDKDVFLNAIYIRQGEITKVLDIQAAERKKLFATLLGIELLEKLYSDLRTPIKDIELEIKSLEKESERTTNVEKRLAETLNELSKLVKFEEDIRVRIADFEVNVKVLEEKLEKMRELRHEYNNLLTLREEKEKDLTRLDERRKFIIREIEKANNAKKIMEDFENDYIQYKKLESQMEELVQIEKTLEKKKTELEQYEKRFGKLEKEIENLESEINSMVSTLVNVTGLQVSIDSFNKVLEHVYNNISEDFISVRKKLDEDNQEIGGVTARLRTLEKWIKELEEARDVCPLCRRPLDEDHKSIIINNLQTDISLLRHELESLETSKSYLLKELKRMEEIRDKLVKLDPTQLEKKVNSLEMFKDEFEELKKNIQTLKDEVGALQNRQEEYRTKYNELYLLKQKIEPYLEAEVYLRGVNLDELRVNLESVEKELEEKKIELDRIKVAINELGYDEKEYEKLENELKNCSMTLSKMQVELARVEEQRKGLESERKRLEDELNDLKVVKKKLDILQRFNEVLKIIREGYGKDGIQKVIRERAKTGLEYYARRFFEAFNTSYSDLSIDDELNVTVIGPDGLRPVESLSGGEKVAVALSLRLALAATLAGDRLECIIMDEPTVHLDGERRRELIQLLSNFKSERKLLPQAIIVSHDVEVADAADQVYEVVKEDGVSKVRVPSNLSL